MEYAAAIIRLSNPLPRTHVARQFLRRGTVPLPNRGEAQDAESVNDFIHKFKACLQELRGTGRWPGLIQRRPLIKPESQVGPLWAETEELIRVFKRSVKTATSNKLKVQRLAFNDQR